MAERELALHPTARLSEHRGIEPRAVVPPGGLGAVHRGVRVPHQPLGRRHPDRGFGHADRRCDHELAVRQLERGREHARRAKGQPVQVAVTVAVRPAGHHELVAADPAEHQSIGDDLAQPPGDLHQQLVAGGMPPGVVHQLEAVEVHEQQADRATGGGPVAQGVVEPVE